MDTGIRFLFMNGEFVPLSNITLKHTNGISLKFQDSSDVAQERTLNILGMFQMPTWIQIFYFFGAYGGVDIRVRQQHYVFNYR